MCDMFFSIISFPYRDAVSATGVAASRELLFLIGFGVVGVLSALLLFAVGVGNLAYWTDVDGGRGKRIAIAGEIVACVALFFLSWPLWELATDGLYRLF